MSVGAPAIPAPGPFPGSHAPPIGQLRVARRPGRPHSNRTVRSGARHGSTNGGLSEQFSPRVVGRCAGAHGMIGCATAARFAARGGGLYAVGIGLTPACGVGSISPCTVSCS